LGVITIGFQSLLFAEIAGLPVSPDLTTLATWRAKVDELPYVKNRKAQEILPSDLARLGQ